MPGRGTAERAKPRAGVRRRSDARRSSPLGRLPCGTRPHGPPRNSLRVPFGHSAQTVAASQMTMRAGARDHESCVPQRRLMSLPDARDRGLAAQEVSIEHPRAGLREDRERRLWTRRTVRALGRFARSGEHHDGSAGSAGAFCADAGVASAPQNRRRAKIERVARTLAPGKRIDRMVPPRKSGPHCSWRCAAERERDCAGWSRRRGRRQSAAAGSGAGASARPTVQPFDSSCDAAFSFSSARRQHLHLLLELARRGDHRDHRLDRADVRCLRARRPARARSGRQRGRRRRRGTGRRCRAAAALRA